MPVPDVMFGGGRDIFTAATVNNKRISEFVMNVSIKRPQLEDASKAGKAAPGASAVPAAAAAAKKG